MSEETCPRCGAHVQSYDGDGRPLWTCGSNLRALSSELVEGYPCRGHQLAALAARAKALELLLCRVAALAGNDRIMRVAWSGIAGEVYHLVPGARRAYREARKPGSGREGAAGHANTLRR